METWTFLFIALSLVSGSLILSSIAYWKTRNLRPPRSWRKRLDDLEMQQLELLDRMDKLQVVAKRKYSRDAVRDHRAKKESDGLPDPGIDPEGWKKEMMKRHVLGGK